MDDSDLEINDALSEVEGITLTIDGRNIDFSVVCGIGLNLREYLICVPSERLRLAEENTELDVFAFEYVLADGNVGLLLVEDQELLDRLLQIMDEEIEESGPDDAK